MPGRVITLLGSSNYIVNGVFSLHVISISITICISISVVFWGIMRVRTRVRHIVRFG
jgi:hypothetical protein